MRFVAIDDAINSSVFFVAQFGFICISLTGFESAWRGIVLHDVVVPVDDPDVSVGSDFRHDRGSPLVVAGEQVERVG